MMLTIKIDSLESDIKYQIEQKVRILVDKAVQEQLQSINVADLILQRINHYVDKSKYVSDNIIKNLVQQKIARELTDKILKQE